MGERFKQELINRDDAISVLIRWLSGEELGADIIDLINSLPSAHVKTDGDLISRADAIEAVVCHIWHTPNEVYRQFNCENVVREVVEAAIKRIPSAETLQNLTKPNRNESSEAEQVTSKLESAEALQRGW